MKKLLILISFFLTQSLQAQYNLVLNNGSVIGFVSLSKSASYVKIRSLSSDKRMEIKKGNILGYYEAATNRMYFKKYLPDLKKKKIKYAFVEKIIYGEINVYRRIFQSSGGNSVYNPDAFGGTGYTNYGTTTTYLYAEKDGALKKVSRRVAKNVFEIGAKDNSKKILQSLISDHDSLIHVVKSKKFKNYSKEVEEVIRAYNLGNYRERTRDSALGNVVFYRRNKRQLKEEVTLIVEGNEYQICRKGLLKMKIPIGDPIKVCLDRVIDRNCKLISSPGLFTSYYEVSLNKDREVKIEWREKDKAEWYFNEMKLVYK